MVLENQAKIDSVVVIHTSQLDIGVVVENQAKIDSVVEINTSQLDLCVVEEIV